MTVSTVTTDTRAPATTTVDRLLAAVEAGVGGTVGDLYAATAELDATVPGWRFHRQGGEAVADQYGRWFAHPGRFEELDRRPTTEGEVVTYLLAWEEDGVPHAAHHCHVLTLDPGSGCIVLDRFFCGGRWNAAALAAMAEADHAG